MSTIGQRQTVIAWWIFRYQDSLGKIDPPRITPKMIESLIEEAEDDLEGCDIVLQGQYEEYPQQF